LKTKQTKPNKQKTPLDNLLSRKQIFIILRNFNWSLNICKYLQKLDLRYHSIPHLWNGDNSIFFLQVWSGATVVSSSLGLPAVGRAWQPEPIPFIHFILRSVNSGRIVKLPGNLLFAYVWSTELFNNSHRFEL